MNALSSLEDLQTVLRVYKTYTVHKLTHLFTADVLSTDTVDDLPKSWYLWKSDMCDGFDRMTNTFLTTVTRCKSFPLLARIITSMTLRSGGLGIQHPRSSAISSFMFGVKCCISYCEQGVYIGPNMPIIISPYTITSLHRNWRRSHAKTFVFFPEIS